MDARSDRPIFARFPGLAQLPFVRIAQLPTPIERLDRLGKAVGCALWVKRDDLSARPYGGNKPRKLEFLLGEALARGKRSLVTFGGIGTHHGLALAHYGRERGISVHLIALPQPVTEHVRRNLRATAAAGARVEVARGPLSAAWAGIRAALGRDRPGLVLPGGSAPRANLGFVNAGLELAEQVRRGEGPEPERIYLAYGSGGTAAGLAVGLALAGLRTRLVAVRVTERWMAGDRRLKRLARRTARHLSGLSGEAGLPDGTDRIEVRHDQAGPGYGVATPGAEEAVRMAADLGDLRLETTYTGKALAALLADARSGSIGAGTVLFWNTLSSLPMEPLFGGKTPESYDILLPPAARRLLAG